MGGSQHEHGHGFSGSWVLIAFALMAVLLLWQEHRAHLLGVIPYLILLACPLMHLLHRRGHRHDRHSEEGRHA